MTEECYTISCLEITAVLYILHKLCFFHHHYQWRVGCQPLQILRQESPPACPQEAYRPPRNITCSPVRGGRVSTPVLARGVPPTLGRGDWPGWGEYPLSWPGYHWQVPPGTGLLTGPLGLGPEALKGSVTRDLGAPSPWWRTNWKHYLPPSFRCRTVKM